MDEFKKINWRVTDISQLEPTKSFISEEVASNSLIYKYLKNKKALYQEKGECRLPDSQPYIPGQLTKNTYVKSCLDQKAHTLCLKALKLFQSGKNPSSYTTSEKFYVEGFKKFQQNIKEEQAKYQKHAFQQWENRDKECLYSPKAFFEFGSKLRENRINELKACPQFYNDYSVINTNVNIDEILVEYLHQRNVLEVGKLAQFSQPNLFSRYILKSANLPKDAQSANSFKLPVSQDENITKLLKIHSDVKVVVSASVLKCIVDTNNPSWLIPFKVKCISIVKDGITTTNKVVFLDRPYVVNERSRIDLVYKAYKRLIKTNFCSTNAFSYSREEADVNGGDVQLTPGKATIHNNATYRIWNVRKSFDNSILKKSNFTPIEFKLLIRGKLDGCERNDNGTLQPVLITPKLEMQHFLGANVPSKSELLREWVSLFFTPFSNLYRVRIAARTQEVLTLEKCNIQKIVNEANVHYDFKPQMSLATLMAVFEGLIRLEAGCYLLQHRPKQEGFLTILKETSQQSERSFDLHSACTQENDGKCEVNSWLPIDVNFILPSFAAIERMPGMFTPRSKLMKQYGKTKTHKK